MKSFLQTKENIERKWYVIDAEGKNLGRVATKAAHILEVSIKLHILLMLTVEIMLLSLMLVK